MRMDVTKLKYAEIEAILREVGVEVERVAKEGERIFVECVNAPRLPPLGVGAVSFS